MLITVKKCQSRTPKLAAKQVVRGSGISKSQVRSVQVLQMMETLADCHSGHSTACKDEALLTQSYTSHQTHSKMLLFATDLFHWI